MSTIEYEAVYFFSWEKGKDTKYEHCSILTRMRMRGQQLLFVRTSRKASCFGVRGKEGEERSARAEGEQEADASRERGKREEGRGREREKEGEKPSRRVRSVGCSCCV